MNMKREWATAGVLSVTNKDNGVLFKITVSDKAVVDKNFLTATAEFFRTQYDENVVVKYAPKAGKVEL